jgi:osmotically-inducible protein OsmY
MPMDEGDMSARIEQALRASPMLEDDAITIRLEGARVHLAGLVDSPTEVNAARDVVSSIPGVQEVDVEQLRVITQR